VRIISGVAGPTADVQRERSLGSRATLGDGIEPLPADHSPVAVAPTHRASRRMPLPGRPMAAFLAQLIANDQQFPQTRLRRRAAPAEAVTAYAISGSMPAVKGRVLARSI
jgi:hypothetical protein